MKKKNKYKWKREEREGKEIRESLILKKKRKKKNILLIILIMKRNAKHVKIGRRKERRERNY